MKRYFVVVWGGIVHLSLSLAASAEEPIRIPAADQSLSKPTPVDSRSQADQGPGHMGDDNGSDSLLNGHFIAGAGLYIVKPYFQNNPAFTSQSFISGNGAFFIPSQQHDFDWGLNAAPVAWLGYASDCGWGLRAHWWLFDQKSSTSAVNDQNTAILSAPVNGSMIDLTELAGSSQQVFVNSNLKLDSWDFEVTRETEVGHWGLLFSAGLRYAHLSQNYNAFTQSTINFGETSTLLTVSSGHNFNGAGPTIALEAKRPIGNSGLSFFANLRGAMIFGESKQQAAQARIVNGINFAPARFNLLADFSSSHDSVLPVAEMEMGAEFSRRWGNVYPFIRTGLVAQTWFDAGSASSLDGNIGFLGLSITGGLNY